MSNENKPNYQQKQLSISEEIAELKAVNRDLSRRLDVIENYLPILESEFAGRIGGASVEANTVMENLSQQPHDAVKDAIEQVDPVAADVAAGEANDEKA